MPRGAEGNTNILRRGNPSPGRLWIAQPWRSSSIHYTRLSFAFHLITRPNRILITHTYRLTHWYTQCTLTYYTRMTVKISRVVRRYRNLDKRMQNIKTIYHISLKRLKKIGVWLIKKSAFFSGSNLFLYCTNRSMYIAVLLLGNRLKHTAIIAWCRGSK
jgi:hypothetical protein